MRQDTICDPISNSAGSMLYREDHGRFLSVDTIHLSLLVMTTNMTTPTTTGAPLGTENPIVQPPPPFLAENDQPVLRGGTIDVAGMTNATTATTIRFRREWFTTHNHQLLLNALSHLSNTIVGIPSSHLSDIFGKGDEKDLIPLLVHHLTRLSKQVNRFHKRHHSRQSSFPSTSVGKFGNNMIDGQEMDSHDDKVDLRGPNQTYWHCDEEYRPNSSFQDDDLASQQSVFSTCLSCLGSLTIRGNVNLRMQILNASIIPALMPLLKQCTTDYFRLCYADSPTTDSDQTSTNMAANSNKPSHRLSSAGQLSPDPPVWIQRQEDLHLILKLIAYLTKYPEARDQLHNAYTHNIFTLIETLTCPYIPSSLRKWAVICMRNACKRDHREDSSNGNDPCSSARDATSASSSSFRRCGNLFCRLMESKAHHFSKCSNCRRVVYCS